MRAKLPNLELLEYKIKEILLNNESFMEKFKKEKEKHEFLILDLVFDMFIQMWGNTSGGFEGIGGSAMTEEYTTVAFERNTSTYIVCFGENPCYIVTDPNNTFLEDLKEHRIKGLHSAKDVY